MSTEHQDVTKKPFYLDGIDYYFSTKAEGDAIWVYNARGELIADAEFDHGVDQVFYSLITPENGVEIEGDLDFFEFLDKPREELAKHLAFLHGESF